MNKRIVRIGEFIVTDNPDDVLITYSLGSCLGIAAYDPAKKIGGLIHCQLPLKKSKKDGEKNPAVYVETGVPLLLNSLLRMGVKKKDLVIKVAGGAKLFDGGIDIGKKNYLVLKKILWKNNLLIAAESVGGKIAKTMTLYVGDGKVTITVGTEEMELTKDIKAKLGRFR